MELDTQRLTALTLKYLNKDISPEEQEQLDEWLNASPYNREQFEQRIQSENILVGMAIWEDALGDKETVKERMDWDTAGQEQWREKIIPMQSRRWGLWIAAAAVMAVLAGGAILWGNRDARRVTEIADMKVLHDLAPGGNKAILTLAGGATIVLDNAGKGPLTREGNTQVVKLDSGEIAYQASAAVGKEMLYNSISTPKGGEYKIILSDGTKVWMNAATVLRYPITFAGATRTVELVQGEAYFEAAHDVSRPFIVQVPASHPGEKDLAVQVLGTSFDVNAYPDEPDAKTTLLSGAIKVSKGNKTVVLQPGQQAQTNSNSESIVVNKQVNAAGAVAWKDGLFSFDKAGTEAVMRQLARWYNVDVGYEGTIPPRQFVGSIPRNLPASFVLKALEYNDVHFRIEGKKIIVTP
jgi:transmembrane sensor